MSAFVYGANHNYFNTIWTDSDALSNAEPDEDLGLGFDNAGIPKKSIIGLVPKMTRYLTQHVV
jgi:hypothetical protein